MKKFIITVVVIIAMAFTLDYAYFYLGLYIPFGKEQPTSFVKTQGESILIKQNDNFVNYEIKGVNVGSAIPGKWSNDYDIDAETYKRWFGQIQAMGANTIRVYGIQSDVFYNTFYNYNVNNKTPLYLIQGILVNDYIQFSHRDALDADFFESFVQNAKTTVDVIHGRKKIQLGRQAVSASGSFKKDVSPWVTGYILGIDWEPSTVAYTDQKYKDAGLSYKGDYLYAKDTASPFEIMLATVGDKLVEYETNKYKAQRLIAFSNYPSTDPFLYPEDVARLYTKYAQINVENIGTTENFISGHFASYHVYPAQTDLLQHITDFTRMGFTDEVVCRYDDGAFNDYQTYFRMLNYHHSLPVVISEFGVASGRNIEYDAFDRDGVYSKISEKEQGIALKNCYLDIKAANLNGACISSWHDEWAKRSHSTLYAINEQRTPYWSDYQTNGQFFGLLTFDPGKQESVCYVDGDVSEWTEKDKVISGNIELSVKYDEKFIYFLVKKQELDLEKDKIYIPIDTTPKSGSNYFRNNRIRFDRDVDFVVVIDGAYNSRVVVQERYEALRSTYSQAINGFDTYRQENIPDKNSPEFVNINTVVEKKVMSEFPDQRNVHIPVETGNLLYGNANPKSPYFNSLADFISNGDYIEIRLPWQLLNFADASKMQIHDDYYDGNYGVEYINIKKMYTGVGTGKNRISLCPVKLKGWGNRVTCHERLKSSYYVMQELWKEGAAE